MRKDTEAIKFKSAHRAIPRQIETQKTLERHPLLNPPMGSAEPLQREAIAILQTKQEKHKKTEDVDRPRKSSKPTPLTPARKTGERHGIERLPRVRSMLV
jgi:hypothetical protein